MNNILDKHRKKPVKDDIVPFLSSIKEDIWIQKEDVIGSIAHVIMLSEQNIITQKEASKILTELVNILNSIKSDKFQIDEKFEDIHPYIESIVINKIGIKTGGKIHSARSRNDQVALDIRLKIRSEILNLSTLIIDLIDILVTASEKTKKFYCPLYTHLQRGQLGVFAVFFINYSYQLLRILKKLNHLYNEINQNPLGACAIGGSSFPINRKRTSELLRMNKEIVNSLDAVSSRDHLIDTIMNITLIADCYSRIAEDLIIWSTKEFNFVEFDDEYASVSSAMPQKKNPDTAELIKGKMGRIYGSLNQILFMSKGTPSGYVRDFQESKVPIRNAFETIKFATVVLSGVIETLHVNPEEMKNASEKSLVLALDLSEFLAQNTELSFREAHSVVGALVRTYKTKDEIFKNENISKIILEIFQSEISVNQDDLNKLKKPDYALKIRKSQGSPNPENIQASIKEIIENLNEFKILIENLKMKNISMEEKLIETANSIINA